MATRKKTRCWPGYEPVPGKSPHEQGSCRKKPTSKTTPTEKRFRGRRERQLARWKSEHPGARTSAAQHLHEPGTSSTAKKTSRKTPKEGASARAAERRPARKPSASKTARPRAAHPRTSKARKTGSTRRRRAPA